MSEKKSKTMHMTSIGGQAVLEGVMMKGPSKSAIAVRKPDGEIELKVTANSSLVSKLKLNKIPIVRGVVAFIDSLVSGVGATMYSAEFIDLEDENPQEASKLDIWIENHFGKGLLNVVMWISVVIALVIGIGLFMLLPTLIVGVIKNIFAAETFIPVAPSVTDCVLPIISHRVFTHFLESVIRIVIFLIYMALVGKMKDMQRVFQYHGAEHKTIACYEAGDELTPENAKKHTRFHPRCGTSFLFIVMIVSIIVFAILPWSDSAFMRVLLRLALLPFVAGISYEIIKFAGRSQNKCVAILTKPGLALQKLTTREPDETQLEVAIESLKAVLPDNGESDKW